MISLLDAEQEEEEEGCYSGKEGPQGEFQYALLLFHTFYMCFVFVS